MAVDSDSWARVMLKLSQDPSLRLFCGRQVRDDPLGEAEGGLDMILEALLGNDRQEGAKEGGRSNACLLQAGCAPTNQSPQVFLWPSFG